MFNVLSTFISNTFIKCYIGYCNFLVLSYTRIFAFMLTLFCPFESGILMTTLEKILYVQEMAFYQVIFNLISTVPSLSTLGTR